MQSPSPGPRIPTKLSPPSNAGTLPFRFVSFRSYFREKGVQQCLQSTTCSASPPHDQNPPSHICVRQGENNDAGRRIIDGVGRQEKNRIFVGDQLEAVGKALGRAVKFRAKLPIPFAVCLEPPVQTGRTLRI